MTNDAKRPSAANNPAADTGFPAPAALPAALAPVASLADNVINLPLLVKQLKTRVVS